MSGDRPDRPYVLGVDLDGVCGDYTAAFRSVVAQEHQKADREDPGGLPAGTVHQGASVAGWAVFVRPHTVVAQPPEGDWSHFPLSETTNLW